MHCLISFEIPSLASTVIDQTILDTFKNNSHNFGLITFSSNLKVHKIENFFGSEFEFYTISFLVMLKY